MLVFGGFALDLTFPERVYAAADVKETTWLDATETIGCLFSKDDEVWCTWNDDPFEDEILKEGKYRQNGSSVEIFFKDKFRISATISGNKMSVRETNPKAEFVADYVLIRRK
jgi:hypothetical protein